MASRKDRARGRTCSWPVRMAASPFPTSLMPALYPFVHRKRFCYRTSLASAAITLSIVWSGSRDSGDSFPIGVSFTKR